ncbi:MAG: hypothetical protein QXJ17_08360 [Nitrososphaeria archaeon]
MATRKRGIWAIIEDSTRRKKARMSILKKMIETGIRVGDDGRYYVDDIEVPDTAIAKALNIDRRVVRQTANFILSVSELENIFTKLQPITFFKNIAHYLGFTVIVIESEPEKPGIISEVTSIIARHKLIVRQALADDPELISQPKLTLIIEGEVPSEVINELQSIKVVKSLTIIK